MNRFNCATLGIVIFVLLLALLATPTQAQTSMQFPRFEITDCWFNIPRGENIRCGYLVVPENRSRPDSRTIRVGVAVIKSHNLNPEPDAIIYLDGGPGGKSIGQIEQIEQFDAWLAKRDLVLIEQRGVGWSQPALDCPATTEIWLRDALGESITLEEQLAPRLACLNRWQAQGIDLTGYNSAEIAADVVDLWRTFNYPQLNIYGISYGTIPAQLIMRDYESTGAIRSVILDGVVPISTFASANIPAQLSATMTRLFERCRADWFCRMAYPNLDTIYYQLIERLKTQPEIITATHPLNGHPFTFNFDIIDFGFQIQYGDFREFPRLIYDIYDGDFSAIIKEHQQFIRDLHRRSAGDSFGLETSINCNEPWQTVSAEQRLAMAAYPEAAFMDNPLDEALCEQWPAFTMAEQSPAAGDIPTLIFTGEYDTRLTPTYGNMVAEPLSRGYYFQAPGAYHTVLKTGGPCPNLMALAFLDNPGRPPDSRCLTTTGSPRFDTQFVIRSAAIRDPIQVMNWIMGVALLGMVFLGGGQMRQYRSKGLRFGFAWQHTWRMSGWLPVVGSAALIVLVYAAAQNRILPLNPVDAVALVLPIVVALQAAYLFSPEDEPALEILLVTPRSPTWIFLERLVVLFVSQGIVGLILSAVISFNSGEPLILAISRWLPLAFFLSGLAVIIALATRRVLFGVLLTVLLWIVLALVGDFLTGRWPVLWPVHLYLQPDTAEYNVNRLFLAVTGLMLIGVAATTLLRNPEHLLLGRQKAERRIKGMATPSALTFGFHIQPRWLIQLVAMIRYEFLLQWRRAALPAVVVSLLMTPIISAIVAYGDFRGYRAGIAAGILSPDVAAAKITAAMIPMLWLGAFLVATFMCPFVAADAIPKDRQLGVRELLDTLPVSKGTYLAGKLLSLWLSLLASVGLAALISGLIWWFIVGPFEVGLFLEVWFIGAAMLILINSGSSMLLATGQQTNRRAIMIGGAYVLLCLTGLMFIVPATANPGWWHWLNPARPLAMLYYLLGFPGAVTGQDEWTRAGVEWVQQIATRRDVFASMIAGMVQVAVLWGIVAFLQHQRNIT